MARGFFSTFLVWLLVLEMVLGNVPNAIIHWAILITATCAGIVGAASS